MKTIHHAQVELTSSRRRPGHSSTGLPYVRSIFIPDDETCMFLFEAQAAEVIRTAAVRAGLDPDRISRADSPELPIPR